MHLNGRAHPGRGRLRSCRQGPTGAAVDTRGGSCTAYDITCRGIGTCADVP
jgi:hypothetical protein